MPTIPESHHDLVASNQVVMLTTNGANGYPQTTAVWFLHDDDGSIKVSINTSRYKVRNLRRDPKATLFFMDPANPNRTLEIRANAIVEDDPDYAFAARVGAKYGGADLRTFDGPGTSRVAVTFEPVKINVWGE